MIVVRTGVAEAPGDRVLRIRRWTLRIICGAWGIVASAAAQAQVPIPVRQIVVRATSNPGVLGSASAVRSLPDGSVIVNDAARRRLVRLDSTLTWASVLADTSSTAEYSYGLRAKTGSLIPYRADSSLFADVESKVLLVIDPRGVIVNVIAPVRSTDLPYIADARNGAATSDSLGRLIYRTIRVVDETVWRLPEAGDKPQVIALPDSAPIVRADFDLRTVDTIVLIQVPVQKSVLRRSASGEITRSMAFNPLPSSDDWAMLPDGTVAVIRAQDYHIDWIAPDGARSATPPMPFDRRAITEGEKRAIVDSVKRELDAASARDFAANSTSAGAQPAPVNITVEPADLPDQYPALRAGQTRADGAGRVWILPSTSAQAREGLLYDVVNRRGEITERVQLPPGRALVGFGRGGALYLAHAMGTGEIVLELAEIAP